MTIRNNSLEVTLSINVTLASLVIFGHESADLEFINRTLAHKKLVAETVKKFFIVSRLANDDSPEIGPQELMVYDKGPWVENLASSATNPDVIKV